MISILTPTIRKEGLEIVKKALDRQTFRNFEWLVGSPFEPISGSKWVKDDFKGGYWTLNRIYNKLIKEAKGDLIISWQDYTFSDPETLERFYYHFETKPNALVSAVGHKYIEVYPELGEMTWKDPRERTDQGSFYECYPNDIEWNLCSCPKQILIDIGGFDEQLDFMGFGMDAFCVNQRLEDTGKYKFYLDQTIKSYSLGHGRVDNWEENNLIKGGWLERKGELIKSGKWPYLDYLKSKP